jgi:hypothetical protein
MDNPININALLERGTLTIAPPETPEDAAHRRLKDLIVTIACLILVVGAVVMGFYFFCQGTDGQQRWGQAALTTVLGAAIAYAIKR